MELSLKKMTGDRRGWGGESLRTLRGTDDTEEVTLSAVSAVFSVFSGSRGSWGADYAWQDLCRLQEYGI